MAQMQVSPRTWAEVVEFMGRKPARKIGHNTTLELVGDGQCVGYLVKYHGNPIVMYHQVGVDITLARWDTLTTRARLNQLTPVRVYRDKGRTYMHMANVKVEPEPQNWYTFPWSYQEEREGK